MSNEKQEWQISTLHVGLIRYLDPKLTAKLFVEHPKEEFGDVRNNTLRVELLAGF